MHKLGVESTTLEHVAHMLGHLRYEDHKDCWDAGHMTADDALVLSFRRSVLCFTVLSEAEPIACFGAAPMTMLDVCGVPWLLGTDKIRSLGLKAARMSRKYVGVLLERFEFLENWVRADNTVSLRWLKFCGFHVQPEPEPYGWAMKMFHRCWMRRD